MLIAAAYHDFHTAPFHRSQTIYVFHARRFFISFQHLY